MMQMLLLCSSGYPMVGVVVPTSASTPLDAQRHKNCAEAFLAGFAETENT